MSPSFRLAERIAVSLILLAGGTATWFIAWFGRMGLSGTYGDGIQIWGPPTSWVMAGPWWCVLPTPLLLATYHALRARPGTNWLGWATVGAQLLVTCVISLGVVGPFPTTDWELQA